ncbi:nitrite/sulfite reductase [Arthrobacter sp. H35-D1]|uniref:nitrite/sulfite reductase n=1 Tax=Arthrobacter sp. H35-D1 TaxID=3046202 RepID=UPI0024BA817D|nr:nitrite/sulfite reductase [Arthrobacter sp. H35-D1]MDJ0312798.1 nitrite/sulfite reductase [Arthrobacter sp. H35-D1]
MTQTALAGANASGTETATASADAPAKRPARPRPATKPHGQWKVDGKAPLNPVEAWKQDDDGLSVRRRIEEIYALEGFDSITDDDLHGRFRWWGLYTQRKQGIDGGKTASLEPHELEDSYFMMRVRTDGGKLSTEQLRVVGQISIDFARNTADLTNRQNIQFHWIEVENVPEIWRRLEAAGLQTTEACGDVPRGMLGSPVAGIAKAEIIDPTDFLQELRERFIGNPQFSNLPRKYKTSITGYPDHDTIHEINDISFVGVRHPELGSGYDLWVGGGLSTAPRLAQRVGVFVRPEEGPAVWEGVTSIFRDYGYRRMRNKARLKFLMEDWGAEKFRQILEDEYLGHQLPDGVVPPKAKVNGDHVGVHEQKDGNFFIGAAPCVGRFSGTGMLALADLLEAHGSHRVRTTPLQKIIALDIPKDHVEAVITGLDEIGLSARPSVFRRNTMACTGVEFCKLAIVNTKDTAINIVSELEERLADLVDAGELDEPLTLYLNGCPNSCARIQTADIGLKGIIVPTADGGTTGGFQVHLGGGLSSHNREEAGLGRTVRGLKVAIPDLPDYVERVIRSYVANKLAEETFAEFAHRVDEELLK